MKPSRSRAPRIEIQHSILFFHLRLMTMPINDDSKSCRLRSQIQLPKIMQHIDRHSADLHDLSRRQPPSPIRSINIPANRPHRSNFPKPFENRLIAHIPRMNNHLRPAQSLHRLGTQHSMRVRNHSNNHNSPQATHGNHHNPRSDGRSRPSQIQKFRICRFITNS